MDQSQQFPTNANSKPKSFECRVQTIADTSKIHTNIGLIYATLGEHEAAVRRSSLPHRWGSIYIRGLIELLILMGAMYRSIHSMRPPSSTSTSLLRTSIHTIIAWEDLPSKLTDVRSSLWDVCLYVYTMGAYCSGTSNVVSATSFWVGSSTP